MDRENRSLGRPLLRVPAVDNVVDVVQVCSQIDGAHNLWQLMSSAGWNVNRRRMSRPGTSIESCILPALAGGFHVIVNVEHNPAPEHVDWLLAHEFAHSLFFVDGAPPRRTVPWSPEEEAFCDSFADSWTRRQESGIASRFHRQSA